MVLIAGFHCTSLHNNKTTILKCRWFFFSRFSISGYIWGTCDPSYISPSHGDRSYVYTLIRKTTGEGLNQQLLVSQKNDLSINPWLIQRFSYEHDIWFCSQQSPISKTISIWKLGIACPIKFMIRVELDVNSTTVFKFYMKIFAHMVISAKSDYDLTISFKDTNMTKLSWQKLIFVGTFNPVSSNQNWQTTFSKHVFHIFQRK